MRHIAAALCTGTLLAASLGAAGLGAAAEAPQSKWAAPGPDGKLIYAQTEKGDRIPDFSNCGYKAGGVALPNAPVVLSIEPTPGSDDDTPRIQTAIDQVAAAPLRPDGLRGALLLKKGEYRVAGTLNIRAAGVVLRGEGQDAAGSVLRAVGKKNRSVVAVKGADRGKAVADAKSEITDPRVPVGAHTLTVADGALFRPGDTVWVFREGNAEWIREIGMDRILPRMTKDAKGKTIDQTKQWTPFKLQFDRVIAAVDGNRLTFDAPLANAIDKQWGGGYVQKYADPGRIENVGVENLRAVSDYDPAVTAKMRDETYCSDEEHAQTFVSIDNARNAWARNLTALHFIGNCVSVGSGAKWVTVQDGVCLQQVSIITGGRRYPFVVSGQLVLVQRCSVDTSSRHPFAFGARVPGPNAFLDCVADKSYAYSEPHHRWSVGGLFDNITGSVALQDRQNYGTGHGWSGANYVAWNTEGFLIAQNPPTAQNWAIGHVGKKDIGAFKAKAAQWQKDHPGQPVPVNFNQADGIWDSLGAHVEPRSLYLKQLEDRLGPEAVRNVTTEAQRKGPIFDELRNRAKP